MDQKAFISSMRTVMQIPMSGIDVRNPKDLEAAEAHILRKVKEIVDELKVSHEKFYDPDFGPTNSDEHGTRSLYGSNLPAPTAHSKYPSPDILKWMRPIYYDKKFNHDESDEEKKGNGENEEDDEFSSGYSRSDDTDDTANLFCTKGELFIDGCSSGDVIQGLLGDCWFLGALAVLGSKAEVLKNIFVKPDQFKEYGLYILRFFKDTSIIYIIIDDRLPVKRKDGKLVFASCKDENELWVAFIEKAYAKMFGCYKSLIGGYCHGALGDLTGYCPRNIVLKPGFIGYSEMVSPDNLWKILLIYKQWDCLMGCSIQSNPKLGVKVEADAGLGLYFGHAYSLLNLGEIEVASDELENPAIKACITSQGGANKIRMVKLRNPWGRGEWEGLFSDRSDEREKYSDQLDKVFKDKNNNDDYEVNFNDGTFYMPYNLWFEKFTSLFCAINFPASWDYHQFRGNWSGEIGGNRDMGTWISNPRIKFTLEKRKDDEGNSSGGEYREVFIGIYTNDSRLLLGLDYYKDPLYTTPLAFDVVTEEEFNNPDPLKRKCIPFSKSILDEALPAAQAAYNYGTSQIECKLKIGQTYYIVPSLYKRGQAGAFYVNMYADCKIVCSDEKTAILDYQKPMLSKGDKPQLMKMSVAQFYEKQEILRERLTSECKRLGLNVRNVQSLFTDVASSASSEPQLSRNMFKKRMINLGFALADLPDDDLAVLEDDNSGYVKESVIIKFLNDGLKFTESNSADLPPTPSTPVDDLLYKATNIDGILTVSVPKARHLRKIKTWFNSSNISVRSDLKYNKAMSNEYFQKKKQMMEMSISELKAYNNAGFNSSNSNSIARNTLNDAHDEYDNDKDDMNSVAGDIAAPLNINDESALASIQKLHQDSLLVKADIKRAKSLQQLKRDKQLQTTQKQILSLESESILRGKKKPSRVSKHLAVKRDITKDKYAMRLLNYYPNGRWDTSQEGVKPSVDSTSNTTNRGKDKLDRYNLFSNKSNENEDSDKKAFTKTKIFDGNSTYTHINETLLGVVPGENAASADNAEKKPVPSLELQPAVPSTNSNEMDSSNLNHSSRTIDIWDYLVDKVINIATARIPGANKAHSEFLVSLNNNDALQNYKHQLDAVKSVLPTPSRDPHGVKSLQKSRSATPSHKKMLANAHKANSNILEASEKLKLLHQENTSKTTEVYRRLIAVPATTVNEIEGDRTFGSLADKNIDSEAVRLFKKFDKNGNGSISIEEFSLVLAELGVNASSEDIQTLFNRFETRIRDGTIDWLEFLDFYESYIKNERDRDYVLETDSNQFRSMIQLLPLLRSKLRPVLINKSISDSKQSIFNSLTLETAQFNVKKLQSFGIQLTISEMERLTRIFNYSAPNILNFLILNDVEYHLALKWIENKVIDCLLERCGNPLEVSQSSVMKLWSTMASSTSSYISFDTVSSYLFDIVENSLPHPENASHRRHNVEVDANSLANTQSFLNPNSTDNINTSRLGSQVQVLDHSLGDKTTTVLSSDHSDGTCDNLDCCHIMGARIDSLIRILVDEMINSNWNRSITMDKFSTSMTGDNLYMSGFEAFLRYSHINTLERKLKYMFHLEKNILKGSVYMFIHVFFNKQTNIITIVARDPITQIILNLNLKSESLSDFPTGDELDALLMQFNTRNKTRLSVNETNPVLQAAYQREIHDIKSFDGKFFYNSFETPIEDQAISRLVERVRFVQNNNESSQIILAEDPDFISLLKSKFDDAASELPFFCVVNDLSITFEVDSEFLKSRDTTVEKIVFGSIAKNKQLSSFLCSTSSTLVIILASYNASIRTILTWSDMLEFISGNQNPFVTIQLLPKEIMPWHYRYRPPQDTSPFTGDKVKDDTFVKGPCDMNGGKFPVWNSTFKLKFKPPKLCSCKIISTEICQLKMLGSFKYVLLMIREAHITKEDIEKMNEMGEKSDLKCGSFKFLTIYDPRNATDYQCGLQDCDFKDYLDGLLDISERESESLVVSELVQDAINSDKLIIGPAITPRLIINVFNETSKAQEELLGSCQLSISSVLSGVGISKPKWVKITHTIENEKGHSTTTDAGDLLVELNFHQLLSQNEREVNTKTSPSSNKLETSTKQQEMKPKLFESSVGNLVKKLAKSSLLAEEISSHEDESADLRKLRIEIEMKEKHIREIENEEKELSERYNALIEKENALKNESQAGEVKLGAEIGEETETCEEKREDICESDYEKILAEREALIARKNELNDKYEKLKQDLALEKARIDDSSQSKIEDSRDSLNDICNKLVNVLNNRFSRKIQSQLLGSASKSHPTDILSKLLFAESDRPDGGITNENLCNVFKELDIDVSETMASNLIDEALKISGFSINENCISLEAIVDYFKTYFVDKIPFPPSSSVSKHSRRHTDLSPRSYTEKGASSTTSSTKQRNESPPKIVPTKQSLSKSQNIPPSAPVTQSAILPGIHSHRQSQLPPTKHGNNDSSTPDLSNVPSQPALSKDSSADYLLNLRASSTLTQPLPPPLHGQSWDATQLPPNWERRYLKEKKKYFYVNHETKTTQWHHPLDLPKEKTTIDNQISENDEN